MFSPYTLSIRVLSKKRWKKYCLDHTFQDRFVATGQRNDKAENGTICAHFRTIKNSTTLVTKATELVCEKKMK